jgi:hypothetical protein
MVSKVSRASILQTSQTDRWAEGGCLVTLCTRLHPPLPSRPYSSALNTGRGREEYSVHITRKLVGVSFFADALTSRQRKCFLAILLYVDGFLAL